MPRFLYLFQVEQDLPPSLNAVAGPDSDIVFLSWRAKSSDPRSIYYPSSSWTQGRNRLLKEVLGRDYLYFVFADDDIRVELTQLGASAVGAEANPWRVFEEFLLAREPAIGCAAHNWHLTGGALDETHDCQTLRFFDALLNAFHHEALLTLLPYYDLLDEESECYSQNLLCSLASDLYPGQVMQTNRVQVINSQARRSYGEFLLSKPENLYSESLRDTERARRFLRQSVAAAARHPTMGPARAKRGSYAISESELSRVYNLGHPTWARRRELLDMPADDDFFSARDESVRAQRWRSKRPPRALPFPAVPTRHRGFLRAIQLKQLFHEFYLRPAVRFNPLVRLARELIRARSLPSATQVIDRLRSRSRSRDRWRKWASQPGHFSEIPEDRQGEVFQLLAAALNEICDKCAVFVDVGAGCGDVLGHFVSGSGLKKPVFSIGIDPVDARAHRSYTGFVMGAITNGPEGPTEFFRYSSSDCSSLKRMDPTKVTHDRAEGGSQKYFAPIEIERLEETLRVPAFKLSTIIRQYGLAHDVLHFVKIDAQGSDLDVFRSLGEFTENCLFLQIETVYPEGNAPGVTLYEGQTTFAEDREVIEAAGFRIFNVARFGSTPEADVIFVNLKLFRKLLPHWAGSGAL